MDLAELKARIAGIERELARVPFVVLCDFDVNERTLHVALTEQLRRACRKGRVWKSNRFLTALKNAEYGFRVSQPRSRGGADGVFQIDRSHQPKNAMMKKLFDRYLDRSASGAGEVADRLGVRIDDLFPVRVVSHHMRILGVLHRADDEDWLVLVDYDDTK